MASLITSYLCDYYHEASSMDCHTISPIVDIVGSVILLTIGALIASGTITSGVGAMCGVFTGGALLLGAGLSTFGQWYCAEASFKLSHEVHNFRLLPQS